MVIKYLQKIFVWTGFSKGEMIGVFLVLFLIITASVPNFSLSIRRSRDSQRKSDVRSMSDALKKYQDESGFIPLSRDGKILACGNKVDEQGFPVFEICKWGKDGVGEIKMLPLDPHTGRGVSYYFLSNGRHFQIFAALEGKDESEYDEKIVKRNLPCGTIICNFGLSSGPPLDKSLEEYENELLEKKKK